MSKRFIGLALAAYTTAICSAIALAITAAGFGMFGHEATASTVGKVAALCFLIAFLIALGILMIGGIFGAED